MEIYECLAKIVTSNTCYFIPSDLLNYSTKHPDLMNFKLAGSLPINSTLFEDLLLSVSN